MQPVPESPSAPVHPTFAEAFWFWLKLGFISFGGPTGQIAIMHKEVVENRRWISEERFLHALNYCMLLPGPEAQQLTIYIGWLLHGTRGGLVAGTLFVLPSMFILYGLSYVYAVHGSVPWVAAIFYGLKAAVVAIVFSAVLRIGKKILKTNVMWSLAALSFIEIFVFQLPFPLIIITAGIIGLVCGHYARNQFLVIKGHAPSAEPTTLLSTAELSKTPRPTLVRLVKILAIGLALWWSPVLACGFIFGWDSTPVHQGFFFSKAAIVTFGGAYAVLPFVAQQAVEHYQWLTMPQMMDGLGLAETTPGPLIMVVQHVGFLGGWNHPGELTPLASATLCALITTWVTFVPCFMYIFIGAPYIEHLRGNERLTCALSAITAAVVGVVLNLAVWFAVHAFLPGNCVIDWFMIGLSTVALFGMQQFKWPMIPVIGICALIGYVQQVLL